jgi:2-dehydro-3-deoxygluconokinase
VVDRFGAGDAFVAGLLWGLIERDLATALVSGAALAALNCTVAGDLSHFSVDELARVMRGGGSELLR